MIGVTIEQFYHPSFSGKNESMIYGPQVHAECLEYQWGHNLHPTSTVDAWWMQLKSCWQMNSSQNNQITCSYRCKSSQIWWAWTNIVRMNTWGKMEGGMNPMDAMWCGWRLIWLPQVLKSGHHNGWRRGWCVTQGGIKKWLCRCYQARSAVQIPQSGYIVHSR